MAEDAADWVEVGLLHGRKVENNIICERIIKMCAQKHAEDCQIFQHVTMPATSTTEKADYIEQHMHRIALQIIGQVHTC